MLRLLVTGGAGFVGSSLALALKTRHPDWEVTALDNLKRRGSELGLPRLAAGGVRFLHGDVRIPGDLDAAGACDLVLECSAEPSVLAGLEGSPEYVLDTNLGGTIHCLEFARRRGAGMIFLSTSRVYPIEALSRLPLREAESRYELDAGSGPALPGLSDGGIAEDFPLEGARSIYGATKLCSELLIAEYVAAYGLPAVVNRCGVLAGPWQMGRVDQGIVMHWASSHLFGWPLSYIGYGGTGKQVRDLLHVDDLADLVARQIASLARAEGANVQRGRRARGLGLAPSSSPSSARAPRDGACRSRPEPETRAADVPLYLSDTRRVGRDWAGRRREPQPTSSRTPSPGCASIRKAPPCLRPDRRAAARKEWLSDD